MITEEVELHVSDVRSFMECRQRWQFSSVLRLSLESQVPNRHLWLGRAIHYALAAYYGSVDRDPMALMLAYRNWCTKESDRLHAIPDMAQEWFQEMEEAIALGEGMLTHYLRWAPGHDDFRVVMPEVQFRIPVPELGLIDYDADIEHKVYFAGTCDGVIQDSDGKYWLIEHKTAASFPKDLGALYWDLQCSAYVWATKKDPRFVDMPIQGIIYNFLRKKEPTIPRVLKDGMLSQAANIDTTYEVYMAELVRTNQPAILYGEVLNRLRTLPNQFFTRAKIQHQGNELAIFERNLIAVGREMTDPRTAIYPNPGMLGWKCSGCPFRDPCILVHTGNDPSYLLQHAYRKRTVEPFADVVVED